MSPPPAPPRSLVPLLALFALVVILLVGSVTQSRREAASIVTSRGKESSTSKRMNELAEKSADTRRASAASATSAAEPNTGRLRLHVTDAATGAIVDAACRIYAEAGERREFGKVTTDADGRASIEALPENTILVQVERRPPHASACAGVWLGEGETRDLEVKVGAGGVIVGRVIDDLGQPIDNAEVRCDREPRDAVLSRECDARSRPDGRFELAHVLSHPRAVSIVDGELRPDAWIPVGFRVSNGAASAWNSVQVESNARVDVGDIVLTRARLFSGRVLTMTRSPVVGAVIDAHSRTSQLRAAALRTVDAQLLSRTRADGSFEFESANRVNRISVATVDGITQSFPIPPWEPGARLTDLELILTQPAIVEIELFDEAGQRISRAFDAPTAHGVQRMSNTLVGDREMAVRMRRSDGLETFSRCAVDEDGLFRLQLGPAGAFDCSLRLDVRGYLPAEVAFSSTGELIERKQPTLKRQPFVYAHVSSRGILRPDSKLPPCDVMIQACLVPPAGFDEDERAIGSTCCGLGAVFKTQFGRLDRDIDFPVGADDEPFWLHVVVRGMRRTETGAVAPTMLHEQHLGPYPADAVRHRIEIPDITVPVSDFDAPMIAPPNPKPIRANRTQTRVVITWSDGEPIDRDCMVKLATPGEADGLLRGDFVAEAGTRVFDGSISGKCTLIVGTAHDDPAHGQVLCMQSVDVQFPRDESVPVRLAPWQAVEIRVSGAVRALPEAQLRISLHRADGAARTDSLRRAPAFEGVMLSDRSRVFRAYAAPGTYELSARSALFTLPVTEVVVRNQRETQVFELSSTRR